MQPDDAGERPLVERLRANDLREREGALREIYGFLERAVGAKLGAKARHVALQPESVVQSVLGEHLDRIVAGVDTDASLRRNLLGQVHRKMIDRLRRLGAGERAMEAWLERQGVPRGEAWRFVTESLAPSSTLAGAGPSTDAARAESVELEEQCRRRLDDAVDAIFDSHDDRDLVRFFLVDALRAAEVGAILGIQASAVRMRAARLRAAAAAALIEPILPSLEPRAATLARLVFGERLEWADACRAAEIDRTAAAVLLRDDVLPAIRRRFGAGGTQLLLRCLPQTSGPAGRD